MSDLPDLQARLGAAVLRARALDGGAPAAYIPELANAPVDSTGAAVCTVGGDLLRAGDMQRLTLQSSAKLLLLAGLLEERGPEEVFRVVGAEPTGGSFSSVAWLETHGPRPANPLVNAGAIALCGLLRGNAEDRLAWIEGWAERLYGGPLHTSTRVLASERRTGDRNRSIAWFLRGAGLLSVPVDEVLEAYFTLCSLEATVAEAAHLPAVLANRGRSPITQQPLLSPRTARIVLALMATCGMYDESGMWLVETGLPAKSGVSGIIVAVAEGRWGIAAASPRVNAKGASVRARAIIREMAEVAGG